MSITSKIPGWSHSLIAFPPLQIVFKIMYNSNTIYLYDNVFNTFLFMDIRASHILYCIIYSYTSYIILNSTELYLF